MLDFSTRPACSWRLSIADAAWEYARLRRDRTIRPPDAIQLACASAAKTNLFITNDARLSRKTVAGVDVIVPRRRHTITNDARLSRKTVAGVDFIVPLAQAFL